MIWVLIRDVLLFAGAVAGLGAPWLRWLKPWPPVERLALAVAAALLTGWLAGFALYVGGLPLRWFWLAPGIGALLALARPRAVLELAHEAEVRSAAGRWALLATWCLGWQAVVVSYSGAAWQGDWYEHYDRAHFFLARWPEDFLFLKVYPLPARPPLANLWSALLMSGSGGAFFNHQVFFTLLSSLVLLPLAALVGTWRADRRSQWLLVLVLMANPMLVQNATFPWTKLVTAFFVLLAWLQLAPRPGPPVPGRLVAAALTLAGGMLAHYSTGPWILALAVAWLLLRHRELAAAAVRREIALAALLAALIFLPWVSWAVARYGLGPTFTQNTAVALAPQGDLPTRLHNAGINLLHTLNPVSWTGLDHPLLAQSSPAGRWRDGWFILYQLRLWWAFGSAGAFALVWLLWHKSGGPAARFGWIALPLATLLGIVVHTHPDRLGLAHISLQPLVLLGLAWLATNLERLPRWLAGLSAAGLLFDLCMGIGLHFALQSAWFGQTGDVASLWSGLTVSAQVIWHAKLHLGLVFLADLGPPSRGLALLILSAGVVGWRWRANAAP